MAIDLAFVLSNLFFFFFFFFWLLNLMFGAMRGRAAKPRQKKERGRNNREYMCPCPCVCVCVWHQQSHRHPGCSFFLFLDTAVPRNLVPANLDAACFQEEAR